MTCFETSLGEGNCPRQGREIGAGHVLLQTVQANGSTQADRSIQDVARQGLGIFDLPPSRRAGVINDWLPMVRRVEDWVVQG